MLLFLNNHSGVDDWYPTISSCSAALLCHPCRIAQLAGPIIVSQFMNFALNLVSVAFIGRLSEEKMAVAVLATSMMSVTGFRWAPLAVLAPAAAALLP